MKKIVTRVSVLAIILFYNLYAIQAQEKSALVLNKSANIKNSTKDIILSTLIDNNVFNSKKKSKNKEVDYVACKSIQLLPGFSIQANSPGKFTATIKDCTLTITKTEPAGTSDLAKHDDFNSNAPNIKVSPNPTKGKLTIHFSTETYNGSQIKVGVYNSIGTSVLTKTYNNTKTNELDISHLSKGLYMLKVLIDEHIFSKKIVLE